MGHIAAEKIGNILLDINPDALIIVEGILSAGNLLGVYEHPVILTSPNKLVYSGHIYPFSPVISDLPYNLFKSTMQSIQTYVAEAGTGSDSENWGKIVRFLNETDHDWAYWSIDG